jgi:hypothetical protein
VKREKPNNGGLVGGCAVAKGVSGEKTHVRAARPKSDDLPYRGPVVEVPATPPDPLDEHGKPVVASDPRFLDEEWVLLHLRAKANRERNWPVKGMMIDSGNGPEPAQRYWPPPLRDRERKLWQCAWKKLSPEDQHTLREFRDEIFADPEPVRDEHGTPRDQSTVVAQAMSPPTNGGDREAGISTWRIQRLADEYQDRAYANAQKTGGDTRTAECDAWLRQRLAADGVRPEHIEIEFRRVMAVVFRSVS